MTERLDPWRTVAVKNQQGSRIAFIAVLIVIIIIVLIVLLVILFRTSNSSTTTNFDPTKCRFNSDCAGNKVCDTDSGLCVDCNVDGDCPFSRPICNTAERKCVGCINSNDCSGSAPICSSTTKQCVGCQTSTDCNGVTPICNASSNQCVACLSNADCGVNNPICNPAVSQCVQCITDANCIAPATCSSGQCCDATAPTITSLVPSVFPAARGITVNYTFTQNPVGASVIFEVYDSANVLLYTTSAYTATGTAFIESTTQAAIPLFGAFYSGYVYRFKAILSQTCGITLPSSFASVLMPAAGPPAYTPNLIAITNVTTTGFRIRSNRPNSQDYQIFQEVPYAIVTLASDPLRDPNRCLPASVGISDPIAPGPDGYADFTWPFVVVSGQSYSIRLVVPTYLYMEGMISNNLIAVVP